MAESEWVGRIIDGRYAVESLLGSGGMGVVLRARHKFTGAQVALKLLRADLHVDAQLEARFMREAQAPNAIGHSAIVKVTDAGRMPTGELYIVMELLVGQSMRQAVQRGLGAPTIRRVSMELLDALAAAHARGFVHRDLKPENVFLADPNATVKLLDFGIAKGLAGQVTSLPGTAAGVVLGTLAYMAPEQLADAAGVDARADLWAMGVMIYEMLSGRLPYMATTVEQMFIKLAKEQPDPIRAYLPNVAPPIEAFFTRALARDPRARFASAIEMAGAFAQLPLVSDAPPPVAMPSGGMATLATGFGATTGVGASTDVGASTGFAQRAPAISPSAMHPAVNTPVGGSAQLAPPMTPVGGSAQVAPPMMHGGLPHAGQPMTPVGGLPQLAPLMTPVGGLPQLGQPMTGPVQQFPPPVDRGRILGFALAGVAAIIIVIAIVIATRGSDKPKGNRTDLVVDKHPEAAPDAPPHVDVPPPPPADARMSDAKAAKSMTVKNDARLPDAKQVASSQEPQNPYPATAPPDARPLAPIQPQPALDCEVSCKFLGGCGMRAPDCVAKCRSDAYEGCLPQTNCAAFSKCYINSSDACSGTISGKGAQSCGDVWSCQSQKCQPGDRICGCRCAQLIQYAKLPALLALDGCVDYNKYKSRDEIVAACATAINNCIRQ